MSRVYVNGRLVEEAAATVSVFDHGFLTGDGVFEAVLVKDGRTFALRRHLERLERSAAIVGLTCPDRAELERAVESVVAAADEQRAKVRITVTAGPGPLGSGRGDGPPSVIVALEKLVVPGGVGGGGGGAGMPTPAKIAIAPWPRSGGGAIAGAKTTSYAENVVTLAWARARGASEALLANARGDLCEGTGSNIFLVVDGELLTPPLESGCLAGVTRSLVLERTGARELNLPAGRVGEAEEGFLTSTSRGVQPIESIDEHRLRLCPGPRTREASVAYLALLATTPEP